MRLAQKPVCHSPSGFVPSTTCHDSPFRWRSEPFSRPHASPSVSETTGTSDDVAMETMPEPRYRVTAQVTPGALCHTGFVVADREGLFAAEGIEIERRSLHIPGDNTTLVNGPNGPKAVDIGPVEYPALVGLVGDSPHAARRGRRRGHRESDDRQERRRLVGRRVQREVADAVWDERRDRRGHASLHGHQCRIDRIRGQASELSLAVRSEDA